MMLRNATFRTAASLAALAGLAVIGASTGGSANAVASGVDDPGGLADTLRLTGVVRDFRERNADGGHTDFEWRPTRSFGVYAEMVMDQLDEDGKPAFRSTGRKVTKPAKDASGRAILQREYIGSRAGDTAASIEDAAGGASHSAEAFSQWFRDVPAMNMSAPLTIDLKRVPGTNRYVFDDRQDPFYQGRGGFFPINGELFGNSAGNDKNFHFTFELDTEFVYREDSGQTFMFTGDDDVWVFVDGRLVIDISGVHSRVAQYVDLDRLEWLEDGEVYNLKFFFAERHRTQSNFRMETTINLRTAELPTTSALYD